MATDNPEDDRAAVCARVLAGELPAYELTNAWMRQGYSGFWAMFHAEMQLSSTRAMADIRADLATRFAKPGK